jgi:type IV fimbrial biogenesis protein FimT
MPTSQRPHGGFTLPELVAVLAITGMLALVALPALSGTLARHRMEATGEALFATLDQARATAIRRGHPVRVCPSDDGRRCSAASDWTRGWIARDQKAGTLIAVSDTVPHGLRIVRSAGRAHVDFQPDGTAGGDNQRISVCLQGKTHTAVSIVLAGGGRIRRETPPADIAAACARRGAKNA